MPKAKTTIESGKKGPSEIGRAGGRTFEGVVVSDKMNKTRVVRVERFIKNAMYGKFVKKSATFKAHDEGNVTHTGDKVTIVECRPLSKDKHFRIQS